jgi:hypothetical protein
MWSDEMMTAALIHLEAWDAAITSKERARHVQIVFAKWNAYSSIPPWLSIFAACGGTAFPV